MHVNFDKKKEIDSSDTNTESSNDDCLTVINTTIINFFPLFFAIAIDPDNTVNVLNRIDKDNYNNYLNNKLKKLKMCEKEILKILNDKKLKEKNIKLYISNLHNILTQVRKFINTIIKSNDNNSNNNTFDNTLKNLKKNVLQKYTLEIIDIDEFFVLSNDIVKNILDKKNNDKVNKKKIFELIIKITKINSLVNHIIHINKYNDNIANNAFILYKISVNVLKYFNSSLIDLISILISLNAHNNIKFQTNNNYIPYKFNKNNKESCQFSNIIKLRNAADPLVISLLFNTCNTIDKINIKMKSFRELENGIDNIIESCTDQFNSFITQINNAYKKKKINENFKEIYFNINEFLSNNIQGIVILKQIFIALSSKDKKTYDAKIQNINELTIDALSHASINFINDINVFTNIITKTIIDILNNGNFKKTSQELKESYIISQQLLIKIFQYRNFLMLSFENNINNKVDCKTVTRDTINEIVSLSGLYIKNNIILLGTCYNIINNLLYFNNDTNYKCKLIKN